MKKLLVFFCFLLCFPLYSSQARRNNRIKSTEFMREVSENEKRFCPLSDGSLMCVICKKKLYFNNKTSYLTPHDHLIEHHKTVCLRQLKKEKEAAKQKKELEQQQKERDQLAHSQSFFVKIPTDLVLQPVLSSPLAQRRQQGKTKSSSSLQEFFSPQEDELVEYDLDDDHIAVQSALQILASVALSE